MDSRIGGRSENQDSCVYSDTPLGFLAIVCDGMGGMQGGATASYLAVKTILDVIDAAMPGDDPVETINEAVKRANSAIIEKGCEDPSLSGMGTTLTLTLLSERCVYVTHLGDSRIYLLRNKKKAFRTFDDSVVFQLVKIGSLTEEQARTAGNSNVITKALGVSQTIESEVKILPYDKNDRMLLCTDGFWGNMPEKEFLNLVCDSGDLELVFERALNKIEKAGARAKNGNHDNLTAIVFDIKKYSTYRSKMEKKLILSTIILGVLLCLSMGYSYSLYKANKANNIEASLLKGNVASTRALADSLQRVSENLAQDAEEADRAAEEAKKQAQTLKEKAKKAEEESTKDKAAKAEAERLKSESEAKQLEADQKAKDAGIKAKNAEAAKKNAEEAKAEAEKAKVQAESEASRIKEVNEGLSKNNASLQEELKKSQQRISELEKKNNELKDENTKLKQRAEATGNQVTDTTKTK